MNGLNVHSLSGSVSHFIAGQASASAGQALASAACNLKTLNAASTDHSAFCSLYGTNHQKLTACKAEGGSRLEIWVLLLTDIAHTADLYAINGLSRSDNYNNNDNNMI